MVEIALPKVRMIAKTEFFPPEEIPWSTDAGGGQALAEFAGRACYESWGKTNPSTATNAGYLEHIIDVGHLAVLEHAAVTFYITGISRSLTHELIRHRHFSYSQLSPRYIPEQEPVFVEPEIIADDPVLHAKFLAAVQASVDSYAELLAGLEEKHTDSPQGTANQNQASSQNEFLSQKEILWRKQARQVARAVLPNATETKIVVTGNYRAWRHFVAMRATEHAHVEIRALAIECLRELRKVAENVFADFTISTLPDGTEVASSPKVSEA